MLRGAGPAYQVLVVRSGHGDRFDAAHRGEFENQAADAAGRPGDQQGLPGAQAGQPERLVGREADQGQGRRDGQLHGSRCSRDGRIIQYHILGLRAAGGQHVTQPHHGVADRKLGDLRTNGVDPASHIPAEPDVLCRREQTCPGERPVPRGQIDPVHCRSGDPDAQLAGTGFGHRHVEDFEYLGSAEPADSSSSHDCHAMATTLAG